jgi:hypothetical protein
MTVSALVTTATFWRAKLIAALCQSAFIIEQQSSGTIMRREPAQPPRLPRQSGDGVAQGGRVAALQSVGDDDDGGATRVG